jgi:predicted LPLAT superfamily acyltransferase
VTPIADFSVSASFNRMLERLNPSSMMHLVSANDINPGTIIDLSERIARGELVVTAGDRTSSRTQNKYIAIPFLGETAPFPYGSFFLAALLNAPTYFVFALRQKDISLSPEYDIHVHKTHVDFDCPRKEREERIQELAENFAKTLESYCKQYPYQWYNFFDFWAKPEVSNGSA